MIIANESVVLLTGASSGVGAALAELLGTRCARVALVARRTTLLREVAARVRSAGGTPIVVTADVSQEADCERAVRETLDAFGTIDVLVNNAGRGNRASVKASRTIARERALPLAPLTCMISADDIATAFLAVIEGGRTDDVYTHVGTAEQAMLATTQRRVLEEQMLPLFLGMRQAYTETMLHGNTELK